MVYNLLQYQIQSYLKMFKQDLIKCVYVIYVVYRKLLYILYQQVLNLAENAQEIVLLTKIL